jgi:hypothetical protein
MNDLNDGLKKGVLLTGLLHLVAIVALLVASYATDAGGLGSTLPLVLLAVWLLEFVYLPVAALIAALTGHGYIARGLFLGLGLSLIVIPGACFTALGAGWLAFG